MCLGASIYFIFRIIKNMKTKLSNEWSSEVKVNRYTFKGNNSVIFIFPTFLIFIFPTFLIGGQLLKEKNVLLVSRFSPLRLEDPFLEGLDARET